MKKRFGSSISCNFGGFLLINKTSSTNLSDLDVWCQFLCYKFRRKQISLNTFSAYGSVLGFILLQNFKYSEHSLNHLIFTCFNSNYTYFANLYKTMFCFHGYINQTRMLMEDKYTYAGFSSLITFNNFSSIINWAHAISNYFYLSADAVQLVRHSNYLKTYI